ncbi:MAG: sterol desaturase family protein [Myxococcota bacterium]|nr:sterol desaturase family protein [Myxococcota bacterium]
MLRNLITYGLFPTTFSGAMAAAVWAMKRGVNPGLALAVITAATIVIVAIAERVSPAHPEWNRSRGDIVTDLWHGLVSNITLPEVLKYGVMTGLLATGFAESGGVGLWPDDWPLVAQLVAALVLGQFGEYWAHRSLHEIPWLWRFHAVHHSPERLYFLNAARFHPVDTSFLFCVGLAPLLVLGAGADLMLLVMTWISVHGLFQHCNVHLRLGPLNYIFSMAELHRWHHSLDLSEANRNYGNNILFWDLVFRTVYWPRDRDASSTIGNNIEDYPKGYLGQLAAPFRK